MVRVFWLTYTTEMSPLDWFGCHHDSAGEDGNEAEEVHLEDSSELIWYLEGRRTCLDIKGRKL